MVRCCAGYFPLQPSACVVWATMDVLLCTASIWHMCTMSLDRYCTLRYPISYGRSRTPTSVGLKIAFVWVVSTSICAALAVAGFANYSNVYVDGQCVPAVKDFILYGSIFAFYVPLVIMIVTYVLTVRILAENRRTMASIGLHTAAGGDKVASSGDRVTRSRCKWDGPVASSIGKALRQTDGTLTGRYRRKSRVWHRWKAMSKRRRGAKRPAAVDDLSNISSSVTVHHSDRNLTVDSEAVNSPSSCRPLSAGHNRARSASSTANLSCRSTTSPLSNPSDRSDLKLNIRHDDVDPQLCWVSLSSFEAHSPTCGRSEQRGDQRACPQCFKSPPESDHLDVLASHSYGDKGTQPSNIPVFPIGNVNDTRRRLSDGVLLDYGQASAGNQRVDRKAHRRSCGRRRHRPSCVEFCDTTASLQATPLSSRSARSTVSRVKSPAFVTDANICRSHRMMNCNRWNCNLTPEVTEMESVDDVGMNRLYTQRRQSCQSKPEQRDCQKTPAESDIFKSTRKDSSSTTCDAHRTDAERTEDRVAAHWGETSSRCGTRTTTEKTHENRRTTVKWSRHQAVATDTSMSPSSTSPSEVAGHLQMSTFRLSCNSISTPPTMSIDVPMSTSTAAILKHRRSIANKERKASKVLGIIFGVFLLLWTPFFVVNVLSVVCDSCLDALGSAGMSSLVWLGYASSLANPIVYTMFSTSFRTVFYRILTGRMCHGRRGVNSGTSYPLSRQITFGDAMASGRQGGQQQPEMTGLINRSTTAASK